MQILRSTVLCEMLIVADIRTIVAMPNSLSCLNSVLKGGGSQQR